MSAYFLLRCGPIRRESQRVVFERGARGWNTHRMKRKTVPCWSISTAVRGSNSTPAASRPTLVCSRTLALPDEVKQWSMTTLRDRLVKIRA